MCVINKQVCYCPKVDIAKDKNFITLQERMTLVENKPVVNYQGQINNLNNKVMELQSILGLLLALLIVWTIVRIVREFRKPKVVYRTKRGCNHCDDDDEEININITNNTQKKK